MDKPKWEPERWVQGSSVPIQLKALTSMPEMSPAVELQREIWGYGRPDADSPYPARALFAFSESGGLVAGAFLEDQAIGFAISWPGVDRFSRKPYLNSQLVGVLPRYRHLSLGYHLKLYQRDFAMQTGMDLIKWTFDPLQSANANLNLRKLGAVATTFHSHYYGELQSHFSAGLATDRLTVEWHTHCARTVSRLGSVPAPLTALPSLPSATRVESVGPNSGGMPGLSHHDLNLDEPELLVEIPDDFQSLRRSDPRLGSDWQDKVRDLFCHYFGRGYLAGDFLVVTGPPRRVFYVLSRHPLDQLLAASER